MKRLSAAVAILAVVTLTACTSSKPKRALTIGTPATSSSAEATTSSAPQTPKVEGVLTEAQLKAALPTVADMPTGWTTKPVEPSDNTTDTYTPASCQTIFDKLDAKNQAVKSKAKAEAEFTPGGFGPILNVTIATFAKGDQKSSIKEVANALTQCSSFTDKSSDGTTTEATLTPMSFPNLGDETLAFKMNVKSSQMTVAASFVAIAVGHNLITVFSGGLADVDGATLEKIAGRTLAKLEKVVNA